MKRGPYRKKDPASRFWTKVEKSSDCWEWRASLNNKGYGTFRLSSPRRSILAHRYAWELANGPIPQGMVACHHCDNPKCVRPSHMFLGTKRDNLLDMAKKGRSPMAGAKLTGTQVLRIRELWATDQYTQIALGKLFDIDNSTIGKIVNRTTWKALAP